MGLPRVDLKKASVTLPDGQVVEVKALTRGEAMGLNDIDRNDPTAIEIYILTKSFDVSEDEAREWYMTTSYEVVDLLMLAIRDISGMGDDSLKK